LKSGDTPCGRQPPRHGPDRVCPTANGDAPCELLTSSAGSGDWTRQKAYGLVRVSYGDQVCAWVTRLHEDLWFAGRYPDTDIAHKNLRLYAERLRDVMTETAARS
jgi:hypothetical protein